MSQGKSIRYLLLGALLLLTAAAVPAMAADCVWSAAAGPGKNWADPANWTSCGGSYPGLPGDKAIFNGTSTADCTLNQTVNIAELNLLAGYTGTLNLAPLPLTNPPQSQQFSSVTMTSGTIKLQTSLITSNMNATGGTLDASNLAAGITCKGDWTMTGTFIASGSDTVTLFIDQSSNGSTIDHGTNPADVVYVKNKTPNAQRITTWNSTNTIRQLSVETDPGTLFIPPAFVFQPSALRIAGAATLTVTGKITNAGVIVANGASSIVGLGVGGALKHPSTLLEMDSADIPAHPPANLPVIPINKSFFLRIGDDDKNLIGPDLSQTFPNGLGGLVLKNLTNNNTAAVPNAGQATLGLTTFTTPNINCFLCLSGFPAGTASGDLIEAKYTDPNDAADVRTVIFKVGGVLGAPAATTTTINSHTPSPSTAGQTVVVAVTVTGTTPTGTVSVNDGAGATCTITLAAGTGNCNLTPGTPGTKLITAQYNGDLYNSSSVASVSHLVNPSNVTVTITAHTPNPSDVGSPINVVYTVLPPPPFGTVTVSDGDGNTCSGSLDVGGMGSCNLTPTLPGNKTLRATFSAGGVGTVAHTVRNSATTTTILSHNPVPSEVGQPIHVVFSVTINPPGSGTPSGTVNVSDGTGGTCSASVAAGACDLVPASPGIKSITATYAGNADLNGSMTNVSHLVTSNGLTPLPTLGPSNRLEFPQVAVGLGYRGYITFNNVNSFSVDITAQFLDSSVPLAPLAGALAGFLKIDGVLLTSKTVTVPAFGYVSMALTTDDSAAVHEGWARATAVATVGGTPAAIGGVLVYQLYSGATLLSESSVAPSPRLRNFVLTVPQLPAGTETAIAMVNVDSATANIVLTFYTANGAILGTTNLPPFIAGRQLVDVISHLSQAVPGGPLTTGTVKFTSDKDLIAVGLYFDGVGLTVFTPAPILPIP